MRSRLSVGKVGVFSAPPIPTAALRLIAATLEQEEEAAAGALRVAAVKVEPQVEEEASSANPDFSEAARRMLDQLFIRYGSLVVVTRLCCF